MSPTVSTPISQLRVRIAALEQAAVSGQGTVLRFGVMAIDAQLPNGGLRLGALHEIVADAGDLADDAAATLFSAGILARLDGPILWCVKTRDLFAPGLANAGLHPDRVLYAEAGDEKTVLLLMEEGLRHGGLAAVVGEVKQLGLTPSRRLQLAAEQSGTLALVLPRLGKRDAERTIAPNAAVTRWRVSVLPSVPLPIPGIGRARWRLDLERCRGGEAVSFIVEACDAEGHLGASAVLADGSATPAEEHTYATAR